MLNHPRVLVKKDKLNPYLLWFALAGFSTWNNLPHTSDALNTMPMLQMEGVINTGIRGGLTVIKNLPFLCAEFSFFLVVILVILFY